MNIKQAEHLTGVSRQNIRFYEREGLITPKRNPENDYREYDEGHIQRLRMIRAMRMLDMPLEQIREALDGTLPLDEVAAQQRERLQAHIRDLSAAVRFCEELTHIPALGDWNVDEMLERMESPENTSSLSKKWLEDYRKVVLSEREKTFTFMPDTAVTNPREFTEALFAYGNHNGIDLVVTKESMYPKFTINGIEYTAERFYNSIKGIPVAHIRCQVLHPEDFEPNMPAGRKRIMKLLNLSWVLIPVLLIILPRLSLSEWKDLFKSWEGWLVILSVFTLVVTGVYRFYLFHFNEKQ